MEQTEYKHSIQQVTAWMNKFNAVHAVEGLNDRMKRRCVSHGEVAHPFWSKKRHVHGSHECDERLVCAQV